MQEKSVFFINKDGLKGIKKDIKPKVIRESLLVKNSCKYFVLKSEENSYFKTKYVKRLGVKK